MALNDYIDEYLSGTKAQLPEAAWDAYTINGNIYAVPLIKDLPYNWGFVANQTMLDDLGVTVPEEYLATTLRFGAEGEGWTDTDNDGVIELTEANADSSKRFWYQWYGYELASLQTTKAVPGSSSQFDELNNTATAADNMGFLAYVTLKTNPI